MSEEVAQEIDRFCGLLVQEILFTPLPATGLLTASELTTCIQEARVKLLSGEEGGTPPEWRSG
jgi:hypothetical protein